MITTTVFTAYSRGLQKKEPEPCERKTYEKQNNNINLYITDRFKTAYYLKKSIEVEAVAPIHVCMMYIFLDVYSTVTYLY